MVFEKKRGQRDPLKHKKSPISHNRKRRHQNHSTNIDSTLKEISSDIFREFLTAISEKLRLQKSTKNAQLHKGLSLKTKHLKNTKEKLPKNNNKIFSRAEDLNNDEQLHWNRVPCPYLLKFVDI